jgi:frataxin-like iron-binding protein CyaY
MMRIFRDLDNVTYLVNLDHVVAVVFNRSTTYNAKWLATVTLTSGHSFTLENESWQSIATAFGVIDNPGELGQ